MSNFSIVFQIANTLQIMLDFPDPSEITPGGLHPYR